jgi:drug/metabolite transporter (DMT)-like permease
MKSLLRRFFDRYRWFFVAEGVFGNFLFFTGSVLFLWPGTQQFGVWLFIAGSGLMLVSSSAAALAEYSH